MNEAVGNSLIMGIMAGIIGIIMIFFVGSISYTKAYKVKNKIINMIEENDGIWDSTKQTDIDTYLKEVGYQVGAGKNKECKCEASGANASGCSVVYDGNKSSQYNYCVLQYTNTGGKYYKVITYMRFDFPIVGSFVDFSVKGETKTFGYFN